jgi:hypothetical protein
MHRIEAAPLFATLYTAFLLVCYMFCYTKRESIKPLLYRLLQRCKARS